MDGHHFQILLIVGVGAFAGVLGAWLFQKLRIPQVVGYIAAGVLIGRSGLGLVDAEHIADLRPFNLFALGVIGFLVGGELRFEEFRKYARQFAAILLGEGLGAFVIVGTGAGILIWAVTGNTATAVAAGMVFGAIASATDPASTIGVLWESRARGALTTVLIAIVALDDVLAMTLYGIGKSGAEMIAGGGGGIAGEMLAICRELIGAVALGAAAGWVLSRLLRRVHHADRALAVSIGTVLLVIGISVSADMDVILATMTLGMVLANLAPQRSRALFGLVKSLSIPVYVLFFVLVGARFAVRGMPGWLWGLVGLYVAGRSVGKAAGAWAGARMTHAEPPIRRYTGMGLFAQGGVAVGLSIMAAQRLGGVMVQAGLSLGDLIIFTVTATTLIVQIIGPPMVKLAVHLAGEAGRDVREEDIITEWAVSDAMDSNVPLVGETERLRDVVRLFSERDHWLYPVVNAGGKTAGVLSLDALKEVLPDQDCWDWLVAADVMRPVRDRVTAAMPLAEAMDLMHDLGREEMVVVRSQDDDGPLGVIDTRTVRRLVAEELIKRRQVA